MRLSGESNDVRQQALHSLRQTPNLLTTLATALRTKDRSIALDAISALQLTSLLPALLETSPDDSSGQVHLTLNTLINPENRQKIATHYHSELAPPRLSKTHAPALLAILDGLNLMDEPVEPALLLSLLKHPSYEVRGAALSFAADRAQRHRSESFIPIIDAAHHGHPFQLRRQAMNVEKALK